MMKFHKSEEPIHIGIILDKLTKRMNLEPKILEQKIFNTWESVVGKNISTYAEPQGIKNGVLFVNVTNSTCMCELQFLKSKTIEKINENLGKSTIIDISFQIGKFSK